MSRFYPQIEPPKFYPQHRNKCYCRKLSCSCVEYHEDFPKYHSGKFIKIKLPNQKHKKPQLIEIEKSKPKEINNINEKYEFEHATPNSSSCLKYTARRQSYELKKNFETQGQSSEYLSFYSSNGLNPLTIKSGLSVENSCKNLTDTKIKEASEFRLNNTKDCVNVTNRQNFERIILENKTKAPGHICSHHYILNDRLLPIPTKTDELGQSLCVKCNKPSSQDTSPLMIENRVISNNKHWKSSISANFRPIVVLEVKVEDNKEKIQVDVRDNVKRRNSVPKVYSKRSSAREVTPDKKILKSKFSQPPTESSLALRYQKLK